MKLSFAGHAPTETEIANLKVGDYAPNWCNMLCRIAKVDYIGENVKGEKFGYVFLELGENSTITQSYTANQPFFGFTSANQNFELPEQVKSENGHFYGMICHSKKSYIVFGGGCSGSVAYVDKTNSHSFLQGNKELNDLIKFLQSILSL